VRAVVADAVQRRACEVRDLAAELAGGPKSGSALFRLALADVAGGIRSTAEADLKDLLARARIPVPLFNPALYDSDGRFIARPDAWWPELGIAIEVDSRERHLSPEDHEKTLTRGVTVIHSRFSAACFPIRKSMARHPVRDIRRSFPAAPFRHTSAVLPVQRVG
jgi:hypothetical protein